MGKKILVSLVSDQTIPNVLFIKQFKEYNNFLFVTTKQMKDKQKTQAICKAAAIEFNPENEIEVIEDNISDITQKLEQNFKQENQYIVNCQVSQGCL